jgi:hypothetical protein
MKDHTVYVDREGKSYTDFGERQGYSSLTSSYIASPIYHREHPRQQAVSAFPTSTMSGAYTIAEPTVTKLSTPWSPSRWQKIKFTALTVLNRIVDG